MENKDDNGVIGPTPEEAAEVNQLKSESKPKSRNPLVGRLNKIITSIVVGIGGGVLTPTVADVPPQAQIQDAGSVAESNAQVLASQGISFQEKVEASSSLIRNETKSGQLNIDSEVLNAMDRNIKESGFEGIVGGIIVRDFNDPVFAVSDNYGSMISEKGLSKFSALVKVDKNPELNVYQINIYLANTATSKDTGLHEIGHIIDWLPYLSQYPNQLPDKIKQLNFSAPELEKNYLDRFKSYLQAIPSGELAPFAVPYEKQIMMGKSIEIGDKLWPDFLSEINGPQDKTIQWSIPRNKLQEVADKMKSGLAKKSLEWFIKGLDDERKAGKGRVSEDYFSSETWGRFLMQAYYQDPEGLKKQFPTQFEYIKQTVIETEATCRREEGADIWAVRVSNREEARKLDPKTVEAQEKIISTLKSLR